ACCKAPTALCRYQRREIHFSNRRSACDNEPRSLREVRHHSALHFRQVPPLLALLVAQSADYLAGIRWLKPLGLWREIETVVEYSPQCPPLASRMPKVLKYPASQVNRFSSLYSHVSIVSFDSGRLKRLRPRYL